MSARASRAITVATRVSRFSYAIRNIVAEAKAVEARGTRVRYLNIGDPVAFGFQTPAHLVETVASAMRDGHNGYLCEVRDAGSLASAMSRMAGLPQSTRVAMGDAARRKVQNEFGEVLVIGAYLDVLADLEPGQPGS